MFTSQWYCCYYVLIQWQRDAAMEEIVGLPPETLNTLHKHADSINNDGTCVSYTITNPWNNTRTFNICSYKGAHIFAIWNAWQTCNKIKAWMSVSDSQSLILITTTRSTAKIKKLNRMILWATYRINWFKCLMQKQLI